MRRSPRARRRACAGRGRDASGAGAGGSARAGWRRPPAALRAARTANATPSVAGRPFGAEAHEPDVRRGPTTRVRGGTRGPGRRASAARGYAATAAGRGAGGSPRRCIAWNGGKRSRPPLVRTQCAARALLRLIRAAGRRQLALALPGLIVVAGGLLLALDDAGYPPTVWYPRRSFGSSCSRCRSSRPRRPELEPREPAARRCAPSGCSRCWRMRRSPGRMRPGSRLAGREPHPAVRARPRAGHAAPVEHGHGHGGGRDGGFGTGADRRGRSSSAGCQRRSGGPVPRAAGSPSRRAI